MQTDFGFRNGDSAHAQLLRYQPRTSMLTTIGATQPVAVLSAPIHITAVGTRFVGLTVAILFRYYCLLIGNLQCNPNTSACLLVSITMSRIVCSRSMLLTARHSTPAGHHPAWCVQLQNSSMNSCKI